ncbi:MAG: ABC transporter ATP-binding protein [Nostoc sp.]|uniref:ABC transporter ATP-binding protein n=1 Tax=Nostoc sp. TaxID=1180 RepID=UPI002FF74CDC
MNVLLIKFASKLRKLLPQLAYIPQTLKLVWTAAGYWTVTWTVLLILLGVLPVAQVYLFKTAIDSFVAVLGAGIHSTNLWASLTIIALLVALLLLMGILGNLNNWVRTIQAELIEDYISSLIHEKAISLDLAFFESSNYYDRLHRAHLEARNHPISLLENLGEFIRSLLTLLSMGIILFSFGIWLPLGLLLSTLPPFYLVVKFNKIENQWRLQNTSAQRYADYYSTLLTSRDSAAEIRLFELGMHFKTSYEAIRKRLRQERMQLMRQRTFAQLIASLISLFMVGIALSWIVWQMAQGKLTLGDLALLFQALWISQGLLQTLITNINNSYQNLLFIKDLFEFLSLQPQVTNPDVSITPPSVLQKGISFEQVTFRYPESQQLALDQFTLFIPAGQIVAIVGENGGGKSTLVKLLCRFYDPEFGRITLDGIDLRDFSLAELHRLITVLFQFPIHYHDTAANNIALSALAFQPTSIEIETAAQGAGADIPIQRLPFGYDTLLGKWFGGAELSGGEWQRVALARAFLRQAPIIILDEPTSAMDSWAEADWLARFRNLAEQRTAIIITHRFTTAMQADIIHVVTNGQVIESGTHAELLAQGSFYAQSWQAQMRNCMILG